MRDLAALTGIPASAGRWIIRMLVVALTLGGAAAVSASAADATTLVSCTDSTGTVTFDPPLTAPPDLPAVVSINGTSRFASCHGGGITAASAVFTGTLVETTCVPLTNTLLSTLIAGSATVTWTGGSGPATTTFSWTVPAALQLGPDSSVIVLAGYSTAGRFHNLLPAATTYTIELSNPQPPCPGTAQLTQSAGELTIVGAV